MNNWFVLNRSLFDNEIWFKEPFTKAQAWVDLIGNANHADGSFQIRGNTVIIKRGQIGWSQITMAKRWKWSRQKVRRFLEYLVTEGMAKIDNSEITLRQNEKTIQQNGQQKGKYLTTILTIVNYKEYQNDTADDTAERQQTVHKQQEITKNVLGKKPKATKKLTKEERVEQYGLTEMTEQEMFEMAKKFGIVTDEVRKVHDKVWADISLGTEGKFDIKNIKATVRTWTDLGINRWKSVEMPGEWDLEIDAIKHAPGHDEAVRLSAERLERGNQ